MATGDYFYISTNTTTGHILQYDTSTVSNIIVSGTTVANDTSLTWGNSNIWLRQDVIKPIDRSYKQRWLFDKESLYDENCGVDCDVWGSKAA